MQLATVLIEIVCFIQEVFKSRGFNELSEDALSFILLSDRLKMDEEDILSKVMEWATVNSVGQKEGKGSKVFCCFMI